MPWCRASTASAYVPILLATSPFAAMRSAPTTTRSTAPRAISDAAATVGDERRVDAESVELPRGEARALQHRTRLVDPHVHALAALDRAADDAERGAVADARERARVAVREHLRVARDDAWRRAAPMRRLRATSSSAMRSAVASAASAPPSSYAASACSTPHRRFTAVGRVAAMRSALRVHLPRACATCARRARRRTHRPRRARARRGSRATRSRRTTARPSRSR